MPLLIGDIRTILNNKGLVKFDSTLDGRVDLIETATGDKVVETSYTKNRLTASTGDNTITITRVANDKKYAEYNCIDIRTIDQVSAIGRVKAPGYVYTGNFSGCVFYVFQNKTGDRELIGVHAYNGLVTKSTWRFLRKPKITRVPKEFGPKDYFSRHPAKQICRYPTRGQLDVTVGEISLAFLSCVEATSATTFLFSVLQDKEGARVGRVIQEFEADY